MVVGPAVFFKMLNNVLLKRKNSERFIFKVLTEDSRIYNEHIHRIHPSIHFPFTKISMLARSWSYFTQTKKIQDEYKFNCLIYSDPILAFFSALYYWRQSTCHFICFVNDDNNLFPAQQPTQFKKLLRKLYWYIQRESLKKSNFIIVNSDYLKEHFKKKLPRSKNIYTLTKGIDLREFTFSSPKKIRLDQPISVLFVKKDFIRGGLKILLQALNQLNYSFILTIIGPTEEEIHKFIKSLKVAPKIKINTLGPCKREEVIKQLHISQLFCVPSLREALGVANLEALASGTPVVSTTSGGILEATNNGEVAWLAKAGSVEELKMAITDCLENAPERLAKVMAGRKWVESHFEIYKQCEKFIDIITKCKN